MKKLLKTTYYAIFTWNKSLLDPWHILKDMKDQEPYHDSIQLKKLAHYQISVFCNFSILETCNALTYTNFVRFTILRYLTMV